MCSINSNQTYDINAEEEKEPTAVPSPSAISVQQFTVSDEYSGHRLDYVLSCLLGVSRTFSQKLIKDGQTELFPGRRIKPSIKLSSGDVISVAVPPPETLDLEPQDVYFETVYEDKDVIVINKPAGLVVHPAPGHWSGTLVHGLLFRYPDIGMLNGVRRPGIVHRLDATTSGLMVVARNGLAQEGLFKDFKERRVHKEYLALCYGTPKNLCGTVKYPIGRDPYNRLRMACVEDGREAQTDYRVLWSHGGFSFISCLLHSGRTHQIRVHMQALRCPLVGDTLYAPSRQSPFQSGRVFLHSWKLAFRHPRSGEIMSFIQQLPEELTDLIKKIRQDNSRS